MYIILRDLNKSLLSGGSYRTNESYLNSLNTTITFVRLKRPAFVVFTYYQTKIDISEVNPGFNGL